MHAPGTTCRGNADCCPRLFDSLLGGMSAHSPRPGGSFLRPVFGAALVRAASTFRLCRKVLLTSIAGDLVDTFADRRADQERNHDARNPEESARDVLELVDGQFARLGVQFLADHFTLLLMWRDHSRH